MSIKRSCLIVCLVLFSFIHSDCSGQRVGVIEKTNYPTLIASDFKTTNKYITALRDLFEKKDSLWRGVYNSSGDENTPPKKLKTSYVYQYADRAIPIQGISHKQDRRRYLSSELFRIKNPSEVKLNKLPKSLLQGFEHNDIIANRIVTDKNIPRIAIQFLKKGLLTDSLKNIVFDTLIAQHKRCYRGLDTGSFLTVKKTHIHNEVRLLPNSIKLGRVTVISGNNCYTDGSTAYGGGILNYIIYPSQEVKLLVSNTELIDVADYDEDGKYEYIFLKSWFNNYGYIMYYDNFQKEVVNGWSYH